MSQIPIPDLTPEQQAAIQKDLDLINREFKIWVEIDMTLVPLALSAMAEFLFIQGQDSAKELYQEGKIDAAARMQVSTIINALSFGMYLGKQGHDDKSFAQVISTTLSAEDERRLLSADSGDATEEGV